MPVFGKALALQHFTKAVATAQDHAQRAPVAIGLAPFDRKCEGARVEQIDQPPRGSFGQLRLIGTGRVAEFGRIDIGDADLEAAIPERIAIDDAGDARRPLAPGEGGRLAVAGDNASRARLRQGEG